MKHLLHRFADLPAGHTVASRLKRWSSNKQIERDSAEQIRNILCRLLNLLAHIVVTADDGVGDLRVLQQTIQCYCRTDRSFPQLRTDVRLLLAADLTKKLVDVHHNLLHSCSPPFLKFPHGFLRPAQNLVPAEHRVVLHDNRAIRPN